MSRTPTPPRCEPPEGMREKDGWHELKGPFTSGPLLWIAHPRGPFWQLPGYEAEQWNPEYAYTRGLRYIGPITPPAEVEALRAENARLQRQVIALGTMLTGYMEARRTSVSMEGPKTAQWDMSALNRADAAARAALAHTPEDTP